MSHASGIRVDEAAKGDFASASNDASCLYLKHQIKNETFVCVGRGSVQASPAANFDEVRRGLASTPNEPAFVVARGVSLADTSKWLLLFFMPEGCTVRDRMVYAASAAALKDGLGSSNFDAATYTVSKLAECTYDDYQAVSRAMSQDDILTLDEKAKRDGETESAMMMSATRQRAIVGLPIKASDESLAALAAVQTGQPNTVILSLNGATEVLEVQQTGNYTFEQVQTMLPAGEPRYVLQHFAHEHDGSAANAFVFVYYCPDAIAPKLKMFYSTCKQVVVKVCEGLGITMAKSLELSEPKELNTPAILDELYPQKAQVKTFKKPARPGRGNARLISPTSGASASPSP